MATMIQLPEQKAQVYCGKSLFFQLASPQFWFSKHLFEALNLDQQSDVHMDALHPLVGHRHDEILHDSVYVGNKKYQEGL